jgi:site-specific DNA recombinase
MGMNKLSIPSPGGKKWSEVAVYRVLTSEVHMGKVIYGRTSGCGHKNKITKPLQEKDRKEWIVADGNHEQLKTEHEHNLILSKLARKRFNRRHNVSK